MRMTLIAQGSEDDFVAVCAPSSDTLHFRCQVTATASDGTQVNAWTINVACQPTATAGLPRCASDNGYALQ
jgi:hypothetical protein